MNECMKHPSSLALNLDVARNPIWRTLHFKYFTDWHQQQQQSHVRTHNCWPRAHQQIAALAPFYLSVPCVHFSPTQRLLFTANRMHDKTPKLLVVYCYLEFTFNWRRWSVSIRVWFPLAINLQDWDADRLTWLRKLSKTPFLPLPSPTCRMILSLPSPTFRMISPALLPIRHSRL